VSDAAPLTRAQLLAWRCRPLGSASALAPAQAAALLAQLPGWRLESGTLACEYRFTAYRAAIDFVNAVAALAEAQDHHPELLVGHDRCVVRWSTHSANGLTMNDFACAAMTDAAFSRTKD
jgi:4a-hydroxytetrahydrobiopterin dehydratase